jgi:hypothetical protein
MARLHRRYQLASDTLPWLGRVALVASSFLPLWAIQPMVGDLAGKETNINAVASVSLTASVVLGGTAIAQRRRIQSQREELKRLRVLVEDNPSRRLAAPAEAEGSTR